MFIPFLFFAFMCVMNVQAMDVREQLEEAFFAMTEDVEHVEKLAEKLAILTGFRSTDEYKQGISKDGKKVRCKKLTKDDKQKRFHQVRQEEKRGDDNV